MKSLKILFIILLLMRRSYEQITMIYNNENNNNNNNHDNRNVHFCDNCNFFLGGLFPIHAPKSRENSYNYQATKAQQQNEIQFYMQKSQLQLQKETDFDGTYSDAYLKKHNCGEIKKERGIQRLEAMLYAIDLINNNTSIFPNIRLGAKIYDTCDRDTIALEKCMNFISDHFLLNERNFANDFTCTYDMGNNKTKYLPAIKNDEVIYKRKVVGVIGAASSSVSVQVANILRLFQIPQISYASTSPELSDRDRFPYFSRVLPSDTLQAEAMANLVKSLKWNYVATISEEGNLGGIDSFIRNAKSEKICVSGSYTLSQTASEQDVGRIVTEMFKQKNSRAVVMFLQDHNIKKLLSTVNNLNLSDHFFFVASDSWGTKKESIHSYDLVAEGAITFAPKQYEIKGFNEYFKKLKPKTNLRNPWFIEFWERQFNCTMDPKEALKNEKSTIKLCTGEEELDVTQDGFIHFVIDSVFAMAHAIQSIVNTKCKNYNRDELFKCEHLSPIKGPELLEAIRNVEFLSITGRRVKFLKDKENRGDGIVPFEVFQYQIDDQGKYNYQKIAEWDSEKDMFNIEMSKLKWRGGTSEIPKSVCKEECDEGEIKQGDTCCWVCVKCDETEYSTPNKTKCVKCPLGFGPNSNKTGCQKLPIEYLNFNNAFSLVPIILSSMGIIVTCYTIAIFIRFSETPIIKASGRELCYVLLAGIMSCYLMTFPLVTKPTVLSCLILRVGVSLSLTVCLSALFTKTNRLSRIFNSSIKKVRQASYVSPKSQLVICFSIISIQIIGLLIWLIISPPGLKLDYDDPKRVVLQCKTPNTYVAVSLFYNVILVILCTTYAIKTRKIPENFNEARFIGFTMYSICIIWVAFIPIYFGTSAAAGSSRSYRNNYKIQLTTLSMCLSLSATVILACLFMPKLKVVLLKPNKNVRSKTGNITKASKSNVLQLNHKETTSHGVKDIVSITSSGASNKTIIIEDHQKKSTSRLMKLKFLWPVIENRSTSVKSNNKTKSEMKTHLLANSKSCDTQNSNDISKKLSIKQTDIKNVPVKSIAVTSMTQCDELNQAIQDVENKLIKLNSDNNKDLSPSTTFKNEYTRESSNEVIKNEQFNEDDEFFIVNKAVQNHILSNDKLDIINLNDEKDTKLIDKNLDSSNNVKFDNIKKSDKWADGMCNSIDNECKLIEFKIENNENNIEEHDDEELIFDSELIKNENDMGDDLDPIRITFV